MANRYANLVGSNKIKDEYSKVNTGFDAVEADMDAEIAAREQTDANLEQEVSDREAAVQAVDNRVDTIIQGGGPDKDAELVDIRTPDASYTPESEIAVAGDMTRDMQAQFVAHKAETVTGVANVVTGFGADPTGVADSSAAFVAALAASDYIWIPPGIYLIGNIEIPSNKIIDGGGTIRKITTEESALHVKGSKITIKNIKFDGEEVPNVQPNTDIKLGNASSDITINKCIFNSPIYSAIAGAVDSDVGGTPYVIPVSGVVISNCTFDGYVRPLTLCSVNNITFQGNIIRDCLFDAIRLRENDGFCLIDGNQFINIGDPSWPDSQTRDALDAFWAGANLTITNNIVNVTAYHGFDIKGVNSENTRGSRQVIVANNQIYKCRYTGISLSGMPDYDGAGNYAFIYNLDIHDNIVQECNQNNDTASGYGIRVESFVKYINIHDNFVISCFSRGIYVNNTVSGKAVNKSINIHDNICLNNGRSAKQDQAEAAISVNTIDGLILTGNICENDPDLPNPYQSCGIFIGSTGGSGYTVSKSAIIRDNICRNNTAYQMFIDSNNTRANNIAVFDGNIQVGTGALNRPAWQDQRSIFFGNAIPVAADGTFRQGDIVYNIGASAGGKVGWYCTDGGNPGTWKAFGVIDT